ncbi:MAG: prepilin peptidase [Nocardioides sp.]|uniref:prepilin peptidase n=1 Tax=Nocardioides sp. TaxID=35761 RepID=UPI003F073FB1
MSASVLVVALAALLGVVIGSFLNVVALRVPAGVSLLRESRCPGCDTPVAWRHNVPVLGWLVLRGRCATCGTSIPGRYPLVEAVTGLAYAGGTALWWHRLPYADLPQASDWVVLAAFGVFVSAGIVLTLIDLDTQRLPDVVVLPSTVVTAVLLTLACLLGAGWERLAHAGIGAVGLWAFYALVRLVRPDGMGGGDVKLAVLVGGCLGWVGWGALFVGALAAFVLGGVFGLALLARRRSGRRTTVPFGPWMLGGSWVGIVVGQAVGDAYWRLAGL